MAIAVKRGFGGGGGKPKRIYLIQNGELLQPFKPILSTITITKAGNYQKFTGTSGQAAIVAGTLTGVDSAKYTRVVCVGYSSDVNNCAIAVCDIGGSNTYTTSPVPNTETEFATNTEPYTADCSVRISIYHTNSIYIKDLYFEAVGSGQKLNYLSFTDLGDKGATHNYAEHTYTATQSLPKLNDRYWEFSCIDKYWHNSVIKIEFLDDEDTVLSSTSYPYSNSSSSQNYQRVKLRGSLPEGTAKLKVSYSEYYGSSWMEVICFKTSYNPIL